MSSQPSAGGMPTDALRFEAFFIPQQPRLFRIALRFLRDANDASDVVQTVSLKVWNHPESYRRSRAIPLGTVKTRIRTALRRLRCRADSLEVVAS